MQVAGVHEPGGLEPISDRDRLIRARQPGEHTQTAGAGSGQSVEQGRPVSRENALLEG
jgi:hypothetical protein